MTEQVQDNIYLVDAKSRLPRFQFADKTNADPGAVSQITLGQLVLFSLLPDEFGYGNIIPFRCDSFDNNLNLHPIGGNFKQKVGKKTLSGINAFHVVAN